MILTYVNRMNHYPLTQREKKVKQFGIWVLIASILFPISMHYWSIVGVIVVIYIGIFLIY